MPDIIDDTRQVVVEQELPMSAKGTITNVIAAAKAYPGLPFPVEVTIQNTGGSSGNFLVWIGEGATPLSTANLPRLGAGVIKTLTLGVPMPSRKLVMTVSIIRRE